MRNILFIIMLITCLVSVWIASGKLNNNTLIATPNEAEPINYKEALPTKQTSNESKNTIPISKPSAEISSLLNSQNYYQAVEYYNSIFDSLSDNETAQIEYLFLQFAQELISQEDANSAEVLLQNFIAYHNENPRFLFLLAEIHISKNDFKNTLQILVRARNAEINLAQQERIELRIAQVAELYAKQLKSTLQYSEIIELYDELYNNYPSNHAFVLQLAIAYIDNQQPAMALPYFQQLLQSEKYADVARNTIEQIYAQNQPQTEEPNQQQTDFDIAIAMQPYGDQFLINTRLNGHTITLLLDTGASITSLTPSVLKKIKAKPLGKYIRLNTANGETQSQLHQLSSIRAGNVQIRDIVVAEVNMGSSATIQGLLGTDFLKHFHYSINNQNSTLYLNHR